MISFFKGYHFFNMAMGSISGEFYQVISRESGRKYWSFFPKELACMVSHFKTDIELTNLLIRTHRLLGILEGTVRSLPDILPFLHIGLYCEAQKSCAIDGIEANIEGMLLPLRQTKEDLAAGNYYRALATLRKEPVTTEVLCGIHKTVMKEITEKRCGKIRESAFLMHPQYTSGSAEYNPPPPEQLPGLLEDLEKFIQTESTIDILVKAAVAYYQFETIHPFEYGNGRVGRILVLLMLMNENIIHHSFLPLSAILLKEQNECFRQFVGMQHFGEFSEWIRFFVNGIAMTAENAIQQIESANKLRHMGIGSIRDYKKPTDILMRLYDFVETNPVISVDQASKSLGIAYNTASKNIEILLELGILEKCNSKSRYRSYCYGRLLRNFQCL